MSEIEKTKDVPAVLAYRVGQLEIAVANGLKEVNEQLSTLQHDFATKNELANIQRDAEREYVLIYQDIKDTNKKIDEVTRKRWVQNTLSAILGAVITMLLAYFFNNIGH